MIAQQSHIREGKFSSLKVLHLFLLILFLAVLVIEDVIH